MAPDRGSRPITPPDSRDSSDLSDHELSETSSPRRSSKPATDDDNGVLERTRSDHGCYGIPVAADSPLDGTNFTFRGIFVGTIIGIIICFSNTYFGLQTGWVSGMAMPASLIGFAVFKAMSRVVTLTLPFTPVENVLVQTVAGAVGMMPLGSGFVGVIPSLQFLLKSEEGAPLDLSLWRLIVWGIGLCLFGVAFGVPLRKQVIIRERLKFPSGTATALMISVLHGGTEKPMGDTRAQDTEEREQLLHNDEHLASNDNEQQGRDLRSDWKRQIKLLMQAFAGSGAYTLIQYFIPVLHRLPIFGTHLAKEWVWTLNPSPAYIGQGIIMGPATTLHMLLGAIMGWAVLSPLAKNNGWASGDVDDWENGSKGWIVWVSLAIMLADAVVNLGWLILRPVIQHGPEWYDIARSHFQHSSTWKDFFFPSDQPYSSLLPTPTRSRKPTSNMSDIPEDAPPHHLVSNRTIAWLLPLSMVICVVCVHVTFGDYISIPLNILSLFLSLVLAIMGVRALGETDLNPVSGISKLTQLVFATIAPARHAVVVNLIAGAVSEAGALQAGDILQDLKAGHLIGASPKAQFYGQVIGSLIGAFVSAAVYKLYVSVYEIPGDLFQTPTAYVWIFTARLVTGKGLPPMAWKFASGLGVVFCCTTALRIYLLASGRPWARKLHPWIPGGIAVAVGMYNTPSFTLARTVGGLISAYWVRWRGKGETKVIVLASGLILGEGVISIVNLVLASLRVPHL
jgi:OPT family oligopeptide transporter